MVSMLRFWWLISLLGVLACRQANPSEWVAADARAHFACDDVEVQYSGLYETPTDDRRVELYEAFAECGGAATYRCEVFDDGSASSVSCCRYEDDDCR